MKHDDTAGLQGYFDHYNGLISGVCHYPNNTVVVVRKSAKGNLARGDRSKIAKFTKRTRHRMIFVSRETKVKFGSMITLTYPLEFPVDGRKVKRHLDTMLKRLKRRYEQDYYWFLEFQNRGAPHIHILYGRSLVTNADRVWLSNSWVDIIGLDSKRPFCYLKSRAQHDLRQQCLEFHQRVDQWDPIRERHGAAAYVAKYARKFEQKLVPKQYLDVGRFWGCSRNVTASIPEPQEYDADESIARGFIEAVGAPGHKWGLVPKFSYGLDKR